MSTKSAPRFVAKTKATNSKTIGLAVIKRRNLALKVIALGGLLLVGLVAVIFLVSSNQDLRQQASVLPPYVTLGAPTLTPAVPFPPCKETANCSNGRSCIPNPSGDGSKVCVYIPPVTPIPCKNNSCPEGYVCKNVWGKQQCVHVPPCVAAQVRCQSNRAEVCSFSLGVLFWSLKDDCNINNRVCHTDGTVGGVGCSNK